MNLARFQELAQRYAKLRIAIIGDFCLDRYFEIDPTRQEISLETGLPVHNVIRVRCQPGAGGTILNNLCALNVGRVFPVGVSGTDGEGYELRTVLAMRPGVSLDFFVTTETRNTFTYSKPLVMHPGQPPEELSRLDLKNWTPTPAPLQRTLADAVTQVAPQVDAVILLDQVDIADTGVISAVVLEAVATAVTTFPSLVVLADSRRSLRGYPQVGFKMNRAEMARTAEIPENASFELIKNAAEAIATAQNNPVFITLAEHGLIGAAPQQPANHVKALPLRGEIDIVGAGDSVMANLSVALASGATVQEAMELAALASSIVVHQLGTTGTATMEDILTLGQSSGMITSAG